MFSSITLSVCLINSSLKSGFHPYITRLGSLGFDVYYMKELHPYYISKLRWIKGPHCYIKTISVSFLAQSLLSNFIIDFASHQNNINLITREISTLFSKKKSFVQDNRINRRIKFSMSTCKNLCFDLSVMLENHVLASWKSFYNSKSNLFLMMDM